jgi:hypothetical protein
MGNVSADLGRQGRFELRGWTVTGGLILASVLKKLNGFLLVQFVGFIRVVDVILKVNNDSFSFILDGASLIMGDSLMVIYSGEKFEESEGTSSTVLDIKSRDDEDCSL